MSLSMAARSKAWVCGRSLARLQDRNPPGHIWLSVLNVVYCEVQVSATA
jgi:hypothetical protein